MPCNERLARTTERPPSGSRRKDLPVLSAQGTDFPAAGVKGKEKKEKA
jgi:hypothetical protein